MLIYLSLFAILLFASVQNRKIWYLFCIVCLFAVAALRNTSVGTDTQFYIERFDYVDAFTDPFDNILTNKSEYLESLLYIFAHRMNLDFQYVLAIEAFIFLGLLGIFYKKQLRNPSVGMLILYSFGIYFALFNGFRQSISVAICLFAYPFLNDPPNGFYGISSQNKSLLNKFGNDILFFIIIILASFIHQSSLILLLLFPIKYLKFNFGITTIVMFVFFLFGIVGDFGNVVVYFIEYLWEGDRFGSYIHYNSSYIGVSNIINIIILLAIYHIYRKDFDLDNNIYFKAAVIELSIILLFSSTVAYIPRVVLPFTMASTVLYAKCLTQKNKSGRILMAFVTIKTFVFTILSGANGTIPYKFYWE